MSLQDTTQLNTTPQNVSIDTGISTNTSLRTQVMQMDSTVPAHLQEPKIIYKPKISYQSLSHNDSIYLNLIPSDKDGLFDAELKFEASNSPRETPQTNTSETLVKQDTAGVKKTEIKTNNLQKDSAVLITSTPHSSPIKLRKSNPFDGSKDWLSGFILLILIIAGAVKLSAGKYINDLFSSIRYQQSASKLFSTFNVQNQKPGWALTALFILVTSLLVFEYTLVMGKHPESGSNFIFLLTILGGIILFFTIKTILYRFVAFVFDTITETKEYLFNADLLSKAFGLTLLPIVSVVPFVDQLTGTFLLKAGLVLFILMYVIQLLRGVKIILRSPLSIFYMFLYFCALEILPLSILIKVMIL